MFQRLCVGIFIASFLLQPAGPARGEIREIRILYVNDLHGFAEPYQPLGSNEMLGGVVFLAAAVDRLRREKPTLVLAAGDMIQGNDWANFFEGESVIALMNLMRFDAMVVGNHEFDFGQEVLKKRVSEALFPVLGANVKGLEILKPYATKDVGGIRVGVIGVVTEDTPVSTAPKNVTALRFLPPGSTTEKYVDELRGKVDLLVVLSHIGFPMDRQLVESVKGIDLIVGGHSHTRVAKPVKVADTLIVQAWEHGKVLGVLDLALENGKVVKWEGYLREIKPKPGEGDPEIESLVKRYGQEIDSIMGVDVGESDVDLDGENVRKRETNLGDFVADVLREVSGAEAAIINGGGIRTSIRKGRIRVKDIYSVLPFDNYIVSIRLTGKQIREALEHGLSGIDEEAGRFPQISGMKIIYDPVAPKGSRIRELLIEGRPVDPEREYRVATNDFMAAGGDGYKAFGEAIRSSKDFEIVGGMMKGERVIYSDSGRWIRDVVTDTIRRKGRIAPKVEGRIVEVRGR